MAEKRRLDVKDLRAGQGQLSIQSVKAPLAEVLPLATACPQGGPVVRNPVDRLFSRLLCPALAAHDWVEVPPRRPPTDGEVWISTVSSFAT